MNQCAGIVALPQCFIVTKIPAQCLFAPRHLAGGTDRRQRRHGLVFFGIAQGNYQRAVAAHGVAHNRNVVRVNFFAELLANQSRQLRHNIVVHIVFTSPWGLRGVDVKASTRAEIVGVVFAGQIVAARAGIRGDQRQA